MENITKMVAEIVDCPCLQTFKFLMEFGTDISGETEGYTWLVPLSGDDSLPYCERALLYCYEDEELYERLERAYRSE